jgi:hypothetical protein
VARELGLPMETVRGWLRRLRELTRVLFGPSRPGAPGGMARRELRAALARLEADAQSAGWHGEAELWRFASYRSQGRLLSTPTDPE